MSQNIFIPELFDCAACGDPTHGHVTGDESSTLCRECFLTWIACGDGVTLEERIVSVTWSDDVEDAEEIAERMRRTYAKHKADEAKHWLSLLAGLVASFEQAFEAQTYGEWQWNQSQEHTLAVCVSRLKFMRRFVSETATRSVGAVRASLDSGALMLDQAIEALRETPGSKDDDR